MGFLRILSALFSKTSPPAQRTDSLPEAPAPSPAIPAQAVESAPNTGKAVLVKIGSTGDACPYCDIRLEPRPKKKKKCPHCGQFIYVRTRPIDNERVLLREADLEPLEEQWAIAHGWHGQYLMNRQRADDVKFTLAGIRQELISNDVRWSLLNKEATAHAANRNWAMYRSARLKMALALEAERKWRAALWMYLWVCYLDLNGPSDVDPGTGSGSESGESAFSPERAVIAADVVERARSMIAKLDYGPDKTGALFDDIARKEHKSLGLPISPVRGWQKLHRELFPGAIPGDLKRWDEAASQELIRWERTRIVVIPTGDSCEACGELEGVKFSRDEVPFLPLKECTHEMGCRCCYGLTILRESDGESIFGEGGRPSHIT